MRRRAQDLWREEKAARERGFHVIAGVDEAGRGPLAGPVVAAAAVLPPDASLPGVRDSKAMTPRARDRAYDLVCRTALDWAVAAVEPAEIDLLNILRATHEAMRRAVAGLREPPDVALIDGLRVNPFPVPQIALVGGDGRSVSIGAASVLAKVTRDRLMDALDAVYPGYGFAAHKGYGTPEHLDRLQALGPCPAHRASFAPVQRAGGQPALPLDLPLSHRTGERGEEAAAQMVAAQGWEVLARRFRCREGEIDVVARDGDTLVFIEVKARRSSGAEPIEAVTDAKQKRMAAAAEAYLVQADLPGAACRFDVVEVRLEGVAVETRLVRGAFTP